MSKPTVKQEKGAQPEEVNEHDEWAKKLFSKAVTPQTGQGQTGGALAPIFTQPAAVQDLVPPNSGFDRDSAIGRFTWVTIDEDKSVPCLYRNKDLFVCIRMAEVSVIGELLNVLPGELYDSAKIVSYNATAAESKLLTYINSWHCDGFYGPEPFTQQDFVISEDDLQTFYHFLNFAFSVLHSGGSNMDPEFKRCGFVRVNSESMIPYTVLDCGGKGVPLFYFEGQTDILSVKAKPLAGWSLAYLKVCCKVQGVRKDLISNPTLQIVTLSDLQAYFPKRTTFSDKCWPNPKPKSLLPKQSLNGVMQSPKLQVCSDRWTKLLQNDTFPNFTTTATSTSSANNSTTVFNTVVMNPKNGNVTLNCNGVPTNYNIPKTVQMRSPALAKIKISTPPIDMSKLVQIPEHPDGKLQGAYVVRLIVVESQFMHCINAKAGKPEDYLLVLQEFMQHFFPSYLIYPTAVSLLLSKNIKTFLPNMDQMQALNKFGFQVHQSWQMPLVSAIDAQNAIPKLRAAVQPRHNSQTANKVTNGGHGHSNTRTYSRR